MYNYLELQELKARIARLEEQLADYKSLKRLIAKAWFAQAGDERFLSWLMVRYRQLNESLQCRELSEQIEQQAQSLLDSLDTDENEEPT